MCRKRNMYECDCMDEKCALTNTWCTPEINAAINVSYVILEIFEVLHWSENDKQSNNGLFTPYINMFLKIKTEASGFPNDINTKEEKDKYVHKYRQHEGVYLDVKFICNNAGLRSIAKLALNSFYGKFGEKTNMKRTCYLTEYEKLYDLLTNRTKMIKDFHILDEGMVAIEYVKSKEFLEINTNTNIIIASFCTTYAQLKLWNVMLK